MIAKKIQIVEVGPRDGLQNEPYFVPTSVKIEFINRLANTGLKKIEATSFVLPKWIPQLSDASKVFMSIKKIDNIVFSALVPNEYGMKDALKAGVKSIAVFVSTSETFNQKNVNCTINKSLIRIEKILFIAKQHNIQVRGYISCVLGCPYEGQTDVKKTASLALQLYQLGCKEISLGDTIGIGTPIKAKKLIEEVAKLLPLEQIAVHFHDTYGQALANIYAVLQQGVSIVDTAIAGLGGCPYARGASGNIATEDVVYMLNGMNVSTGVNLERLIDVSQFVSQVVGHPVCSKVALAELAKKYDSAY